MTDDLDDLLIEQFLAAGDTQYIGPKCDNFKDDSTYYVNKLWLRNLARIAYNTAIEDAHVALNDSHGGAGISLKDVAVLHGLIKK